MRSSFGRVGPFVGPFVQEGPVEALRLAVGLGSIGAGREMPRRAEGGLEHLGHCVVPHVVGHWP